MFCGILSFLAHSFILCVDQLNVEQTQFEVTNECVRILSCDDVRRDEYFALVFNIVNHHLGIKNRRWRSNERAVN